MQFTFAKNRKPLAIKFICIGIIVFLVGAFQHNFGGWFLGIGVALISAGVSMPFARFPFVIVIAVVSPYIAFWLSVIVLWTVLIPLEGYKLRHHQAFAANGLDQIEPAAQMDQLFADCRHSIVYSGHDSVPTWDAVAYFGGRYELRMQAHLAIESGTEGRMIGEPSFQILEVARVDISPSGQVGASFSNQRIFGPEEWTAVFNAGGDFSVIGFPQRTDPPVQDFDVYARGTRQQ